MKKSIRSVKVVAPLLLTPALTGQPQAASARSIDPVEAGQIEPGCAPQNFTLNALDRGLPWSIFDLTVAEKLTLGGHRVRGLTVFPERFAQKKTAPLTTDLCGATQKNFNAAVPNAKVNSPSPNVKLNIPSPNVKPPPTPPPPHIK